MQPRLSTASEHDAIRALLQGSALPVEDLDAASIEFIVVVEYGTLLGVVGLESDGEVGLLRSLAVERAHRESGTGVALLQAMEAHARRRGLSQLVLLTQTADAFFANHGYRTIARHEAPVAVQSFAEFRSICPASARCMIKCLAPEVPA
jgi:amino-acid N-acetyltransferase